MTLAGGQRLQESGPVFRSLPAPNETHPFHEFRPAVSTHPPPLSAIARWLAGIWLGTREGRAAAVLKKDPARPWLSSQFPAKAKRVIYLHMAGSPSQLELFDYKPELTKLDGRDCPQSFLAGKQFAFIQGVPKCSAMVSIQAARRRAGSGFPTGCHI